jgi:hypothetical protein
MFHCKQRLTFKRIEASLTSLRTEIISFCTFHWTQLLHETPDKLKDSTSCNPTPTPKQNHVLSPYAAPQFAVRPLLPIAAAPNRFSLDKVRKLPTKRATCRHVYVSLCAVNRVRYVKFFTRDRRKTSLVTEYNSILELIRQTWIITVKNVVSSHYSVCHKGDKYLWFAYLSAEYTVCYLHNCALWGQWLEFLEPCTWFWVDDVYFLCLFCLKSIHLRLDISIGM